MVEFFCVISKPGPVESPGNINLPLITVDNPQMLKRLISAFFTVLGLSAVQAQGLDLDGWRERLRQDSFFRTRVELEAMGVAAWPIYRLMLTEEDLRVVFDGGSPAGLKYQNLTRLMEPLQVFESADEALRQEIVQVLHKLLDRQDARADRFLRAMLLGMDPEGQHHLALEGGDGSWDALSPVVRTVQRLAESNRLDPEVRGRLWDRLARWVDNPKLGKFVIPTMVTLDRDRSMDLVLDADRWRVGHPGNAAVLRASASCGIEVAVEQLNPFFEWSAESDERAIWLARDAIASLAKNNPPGAEARLWKLAEHTDARLREASAQMLLHCASLENPYGRDLNYAYIRDDFAVLPSPTRELCSMRYWWDQAGSEGLSWMLDHRAGNFQLSMAGAKVLGDAEIIAWFEAVDALFGPTGMPVDAQAFDRRLKQIGDAPIDKLQRRAEQIYDEVEAGMALFAMRHPELVSVPLSKYPAP